MEQARRAGVRVQAGVEVSAVPGAVRAEAKVWARAKVKEWAKVQARAKVKEWAKVQARAKVKEWAREKTRARAEVPGAVRVNILTV